ncbi:MAG: ImmA/IrrE family metallo-endopeptidase [Cyclobacteriaceae bacterium]|nr:ImmA/IrrE family metallo-endopeptidase [Cyclobacteriaceae bacterium]
MLLTKAEATARKVLTDFGLDDINAITSTELKTIIQARGGYYEEIDLKNIDGRIITFEGKSIISINKNIAGLGKKRFTAAHELGHFELHKNIQPPADTQYELCNWYQSGSHEKEANDFASELLMPTNLFLQQCKGKKFGPQLIKQLAEIFQVTHTAIILKALKANIHPICVIAAKNNKIKWWKMSQNMESADHDFVPGWTKYKIRITSNLPPPPDSVVGQFFKSTGNKSLETLQEIDKSTWFLTHQQDNPIMFEYCNYIREYDFGLSVVWQD